LMEEASASEEKAAKKLEEGLASSDSSTSSDCKHGDAAADAKKDSAIKKLLEESDTEESLNTAERSQDSPRDAEGDKTKEWADEQLSLA